MAYIETSNLDGETNLKLKQALPVTAEFDFDDELKKLKGDLEAEAPTKHLYEFYGSFKKKGDDQVHPLDQGQLLLRGSQLRNTKWIYGLGKKFRSLKCECEINNFCRKLPIFFFNFG